MPSGAQVCGFTCCGQQADQRSRRQTGHPAVLSPDGWTGAYCERPSILRDNDCAGDRTRSNAEFYLCAGQRQRCRSRLKDTGVTKQDLRSTVERQRPARADNLMQDRWSEASHPTITDEELIASLRESAEQLRLFVEQAPVGIAMFDRDMRYLATSERWLSSYGFSGESLVGRSHYEVVPDIPKSWKEAHQRALSGETVREERDPFPRADGRFQFARSEQLFSKVRHLPYEFGSLSRPHFKRQGGGLDPRYCKPQYRE